ncbi:putative Biotin apo-protein ligase [Taphrina deformans PYCC 5710]|uniref:Biotin apo-protein ligase n=1 Tax=Taphrina deformans (strain PYCC 5710 / ATCC 11124 / CBS 356.35 / IMI 108563 / JCM 9778 / NBRC 8474) TaxID=1097556 RepID=R4XER6_TAPDE|nr:putative Biotin apo-protein ligase [Taphrina deformans PYCC 5710]|eukprot:CCG82966.1 putative Biotin apo-protein ligase [Taphrina deformans PYCC 5710]
MNVLIYDGPGTSKASRLGCYTSLNALLSPRYSIRYLSPLALINEPWASTTALFVVPGGRDLPYCDALNGDGTRKIDEYVRRGGKYLGLCAGAYFASKTVEFELGTDVAVQGPRELALWSGTSRGCAFPGFKYDSEVGARVTKVSIVEKPQDLESATNKLDLNSKSRQESAALSIYWNGGGVFVAADKDTKVNVLASYQDPVIVDGGSAAVIALSHSQGRVVLSAVHPEISPAKMRTAGRHAAVVSTVTQADSSSAEQSAPGMKKLNPAASSFVSTAELQSIHQSQNDDRYELLRIMLRSLNIEVNEKNYVPPTLSTMYLLSYSERSRLPVLNTLKALVTHISSGISFIKSDSDTFGLVNEDTRRLDTVTNVDEEFSISPEEQVKYICIARHFPEFPLFDARKFFALLHRLHYASQAPSKKYAEPSFGTSLLYAETVTSSQSLLDKNFSLERHLPNGFTILCSHQLSGRGRGQNSWVSPTGVLSFSTILHHVPIKGQPAESIIFIQYLLSLAVSESILKLRPKLGIKIKWPNDIYLAIPETQKNVTGAIMVAGRSYAKVSGSLITTSWYGGKYVMTLGVGINVFNPQPTISLNSFLPADEAICLEELFATVLVSISEHYQRFVASECSFASFEARYYELWLHNNQAVKLEVSGESGVVKGINLTDGTLRVQGTNGDFGLQADGNSFDMMRGLIKVKR